MKKSRRYLLTFVLLVFMVSGASILAQTEADGGRGFGAPPIDRPVGLLTSTDAVTDGYILVTMVQSKDVLLLSNDGHIVHKWEGEHYTGASAYLLENGNLLRTVSIDDNFGFGQNGQWGYVGGRIEEVTWDNEVVWAFDYASDAAITHHDIELMPNGNLLISAFERTLPDELTAIGFDPENLPEAGEIWMESIIEVDRSTNEIVWEWHLADHLIQDFDENAENYGVVADNPGLVDINYNDPLVGLVPNWWHNNSVDYNPELDQILLSPRQYSEVWIIDHSITTEEARGEAGNLLYRWGNPQTYHAGTAEDRVLYFQHDPRWIPEDYPHDGTIMIYNNGSSERLYTDVLEITPPVDEDGNYVLEPGQAAGPAEPDWVYYAPEPTVFYSFLMSGAQRLPNGNTLFSEGLVGKIFEIAPDGEVVFEYNMPPATWVFRAERYNWPVLAEFDLSQDVGFEGGLIWGLDCVDGTQPRLYEYDFMTAGTIPDYVAEHGDDAQAHWEVQACVEHGGIAAPEDQDAVWGATCADGTQTRLYRGFSADAASMDLFVETYGDDARSHWEAESCEPHGGLAEE